MVRYYRDLVAWQKAMVLVTEVYKLSRFFPKEELYGLTNQLRRAAISVPSNIAEGCARRSKQEFSRYINISAGSLAEVETQISIAKNLGYIKDENIILNQTSELAKILHGLRNSLTTNN